MVTGWKILLFLGCGCTSRVDVFCGARYDVTCFWSLFVESFVLKWSVRPPVRSL